MTPQQTLPINTKVVSPNGVTTSQKVKSTDSFIFWDVHDIEGVNGLGKQIRVLQAGNRHVSTGQEAVLAEILQAQLR